MSVYSSRQALMDSSELLVSIRGRNGSGREGPVIFGPNAIWQQDPVTQVINLPSGECISPLCQRVVIGAASLDSRPGGGFLVLCYQPY